MILHNLKLRFWALTPFGIGILEFQDVDPLHTATCINQVSRSRKPGKEICVISYCTMKGDINYLPGSCAQDGKSGGWLIIIIQVPWVPRQRVVSQNTNLMVVMELDDIFHPNSSGYSHLTDK